MAGLICHPSAWINVKFDLLRTAVGEGSLLRQRKGVNFSRLWDEWSDCDPARMVIRLYAAGVIAKGLAAQLVCIDQCMLLAWMWAHHPILFQNEQVISPFAQPVSQPAAVEHGFN